MSTPREWQTQADAWATEAVAQGTPNAWFEPLYAAGRAGDLTMPWDRDGAHPVLAEWVVMDTGRPVAGRAAVVGCGLGTDAELLAGLGFDTTGFDLSASAIAEARRRYPDSAVHYAVADLLDPPADWRQAYDLVVEIYTVQAVPESMRAEMTKAVTDLVAPGGSLFVVQMTRADGQEVEGPPWPMTRAQVEAFAADDLDVITLDVVDHPTSDGVRLWRAHLRRATA
jgi:SAM-dependent methyltransferase